MADSIIEKVLMRPELLKDAYPTISEKDLEATHEELGFELPPLLQELYLKVGNGGFGPHFGGFMGGINGWGESEENIVSIYNLFCSDPIRHPWPEKLLPFFHWGCACRCCLDCTQKDGPVIFYDPGYFVSYYAEDDPKKEGDPIIEDPVPAMTIEATSLEEWLNGWLDGTAKMGYGKPPWRPNNWNPPIPKKSSDTANKKQLRFKF